MSDPVEVGMGLDAAAQMSVVARASGDAVTNGFWAGCPKVDAALTEEDGTPILTAWYHDAEGERADKALKDEKSNVFVPHYDLFKLPIFGYTVEKTERELVLDNDGKPVTKIEKMKRRVRDEHGNMIFKDVDHVVPVTKDVKKVETIQGEMGALALKFPKATGVLPLQFVVEGHSELWVIARICGDLFANLVIRKCLSTSFSFYFLETPGAKTRGNILISAECPANLLTPNNIQMIRQRVRTYRPDWRVAEVLEDKVDIRDMDT